MLTTDEHDKKNLICIYRHFLELLGQTEPASVLSTCLTRQALHIWLWPSVLRSESTLLTCTLTFQKPNTSQ